MTNGSTLRDFLQALFSSGSPLDGLGHSGTINIETGWAEVASKYYGACRACERQFTTARDCSFCGRKGGNNVGFLAGRGDGVYSGITLMSANSIIGAIFVFDEQNEFATASAAELQRSVDDSSLRDNKFQEILLSSCSQYFDLQPTHAGSVSAESSAENEMLGFVVADASYESDREFSSVDVMMARGDFHVFLYTEPFESSPLMAIYDQIGSSELSSLKAEPGVRRPRVALILKDDFVENFGFSRFQAQDWPHQVAKWHELPVASNIGHNNAARALANNGIFWLLVVRDNPDTDLWYLYSTRAFGFFVQGALLGDDDCTWYMIDQIEHSENNDILDPEVLKSALAPRGIRPDARVRDDLFAMLNAGKPE